MLSRLLSASLSSLMVCSVLSAQTSSSLITNDPREQYTLVKATLAQFAANGLMGFRGSGAYDVGQCVDASNYLPYFGKQVQQKNEELEGLLDIAILYVTWEHDFRKLGIPPSVWEPILRSGEEEALRSHIQHTPEDQQIKEQRATEQRLAAALNRYREEKNPSLGKFYVHGGCGSGEIEVHIALTPPDGQLFLIPVFLYKLCEAQHLNPADPKACDHWTEVVNGAASYVSGDYVYLARWTDGAVRCGPLGFKGAGDNGKTFSITKLRSPECSPGW
jgi:hypothetical protein